MTVRPGNSKRSWTCTIRWANRELIIKGEWRHLGHLCRETKWAIRRSYKRIPADKCWRNVRTSPFAIPTEIIQVANGYWWLRAAEEVDNGWIGLSQPILTSQKERQPKKYQPNTVWGHCLNPNPNKPSVGKTSMRALGNLDNDWILVKQF